MPRTFLSLLLTLPLLAAPATAQKLGDVPKEAPSRSVDKGDVLEWQSSAGRPYWYRVPKKLGDRPTLLLMLHGTGGNHGWSFWNYPIAANNWRPDDIVVSPDGVTPGQGGTFNFVQGKKDGDQLVELIKTFQDAFDIGKVYVYGHSQGAFFCYWFAGAHPELVDGIVAHAGNVLDVAHPKLAKEKVGVAILHGEADAVVPVSCATRTHGIYEKEGYQKLRLEIVEGLTAQSGHWPLPKQVAELLAWLDTVTASTAPAALAAALSELHKDAPDLAIVLDCAERARELLSKHKGDDAAELEARLTAVEGLLAEARSAHADALDAAGADAKIETFEPWIEHFRIANAAFADDRDWQSRMQKLVSRVKKDQARSDKALDALQNKKWNKRAFASTVTSLEKALLAGNHRELCAALSGKLKEETKGISADDVAATEKMLAERTTAAEAGRSKANEVTAELAKAFRDAHPDWF